MFIKLILTFALFFTTIVPLAHATEIEWEITNRFSPFETFGNKAPEMFEKYKFQLPTETAMKWYERLSGYKHGDPNSGIDFVSPYADALHKGDTHLLPWNSYKQEHNEIVVKLAREDDKAFVRVKFKIDLDGTCEWTIIPKTEKETDPKLVASSPCRTHTSEVELPIKGAYVGIQNRPDFKPQDITPNHIVIVAMGDSYGSGEGNPDVPAVWKDWDKWSPKDNTFKWLREKTASKERPDYTFDWLDKPSIWLDQRCHRSFMSKQTLTALSIASEEPQNFVSYLHYSCTGAEMMDGVLIRQFGPAGFGKIKRSNKNDAYNSISQIDLAVSELCRGKPREYKLTNTPLAMQLGRITPLNANLNDPRTYDDDKKPLATSSLSDERYIHCEDGVNPADFLLLSIGGNDVGFSSLVHFHVAPAEHISGLIRRKAFAPLCPESDLIPTYSYTNDSRKKFCENRLNETGVDIGGLIKLLPAKYDLTFSQLSSRLSISPNKIFLDQYPDPLRLDKEVHAKKKWHYSDLDCAKFGFYAECSGHWSNPRHTSPWEALKNVVPFDLNTKVWQFNLVGYHYKNKNDAGKRKRGNPDKAGWNSSEVCMLLMQINRFRDQIDASVRGTNVNLVSDLEDAFYGHSWQEGIHRNLPNTSNYAQPAWKVQDWKAYRFEPDGRMIRTPNDSYLTQASEIDSAKDGTAHPSLLGHANSADIIISKMKCSNDKTITECLKMKQQSN